MPVGNLHHPVVKPVAHCAFLVRHPGLLAATGRLLIAAVGLAATPLFTRILTPTEYGLLAISLSISTMASSVPTQWISSATLRFGPNVDVKTLGRAITRALLMTLGATTLMALAGAYVAFTGQIDLVALTVMYALSEAVFVSRWVAVRAKLRIVTYIMAGIVRNACSLALVAAIYGARGQVSLEIVLISLIVASIAGTAVTARSKERHGPDAAARAELASWFRFGWPLIINYAFGVALLYWTRFALLHFSGPEAVARFAPTHDLLFAIVTLIVGLVGLTTVPAIYGTDSEAVARDMLRSLRRSVIAASICVPLTLWLTWPWISVPLISSQLRTESQLFVGILCLSFGLMAYRFQYQNIVIQYAQRSMMQTSATAVGLAVSIVVSLVLVPGLGPMGAAYSTLAGATSASVFSFALSTNARLGRRGAQE